MSQTISEERLGLIVLIGYRGTGKTSVARLLSQRLRWNWMDADDEIERRAGKTIAGIFADGGEQAFRDLESEVIEDLAALDQTVLALGGGAVVRERNRRALAGRGTVVWLRASADTIRQRIAADETTAERRPNLTASGGYDEIKELLAERTPVYREFADAEVDTEGKTPGQVAEEIIGLLGRSA